MTNDDLLEEILDGEQLKAIIQNQLQENNPVRVKETMMRLMMTGTPRNEAIALMACALGLEMEAMVSTNTPFNLVSYCKKLDELPNAPWLDDVE